MKVLAIFDNGGRTIDRYTVVTNLTGAGIMFDMLGCDDNGGTAFSQWTVGQYDTENGNKNRHLGKRVKFEDLNEITQRHIAERLFL